MQQAVCLPMHNETLACSADFTSLEYFKTYLKYEKNTKARQLLGTLLELLGIWLALRYGLRCPELVHGACLLHTRRSERPSQTR